MNAISVRVPFGQVMCPEVILAKAGMLIRSKANDAITKARLIEAARGYDWHEFTAETGDYFQWRRDDFISLIGVLWGSDEARRVERLAQTS